MNDSFRKNIEEDNIPDKFIQRIKEAKEKQLEELDLSNEYNADDQDKLTKIPEEVFQLNHLKVLIIQNHNISNPPESLGNLTSLTELNLIGNKLSSLPESLGNLTNLTRLNLYKNKLSSLPESLGNLTSLTTLVLDRNLLSSLPESIGNLTSLTDLHLEVNRLSSLPESFGNLTNLISLYLRTNKLSVLPESFVNLTSLIKLDLSKNQLSSLPEYFGNFTSLTKLYLKDNNLSSLPESLIKIPSLTNLDLSGNLLITPPPEVAAKGIEAIREYFRQLKEEGEDYIYEAKLLIVGEGGAGKTSLAKKIQDPKYKLQESEQSTEGIDVIKWNFPIFDKEQKERQFKVNIWDFGGQEIYHATHQFFLTKRSLYNLVADTRREDTDFHYWLNIVELLSDNSPLLIIKNEKQDRKREINEPALHRQFTNLKETLATNLATNRGLEEVITNIQCYIQKLPHIGERLPTTWVKVRQALEHNSHNYISLQEYLDICQENGFTKLEDKLQLSGYLHDLGVCLHFQDEEDSLLYKTVILKPEWGTDAVYKVLDNKEIINNQGYFTRKDLKNIWQVEKYALMRGELLELMKKFQLCYEIANSKDTFIAPQLLSDKQPEYDWNESQNLFLRYTYPDFMPKGIITRFIVIMHEYIEQQKYVWKTGVILNQDNTKAKIIEDYGKREIKIYVEGINKRNFLTIITHELDKISNSFNRLKYQKLIPCNCETCINNPKPFNYDFNRLVKRLANNKLTIECDNPPYNDVQVLSLIDNTIDIEEYISQNKQDNNPQINLIGNVLGNFIQSDRNIDISQGNYNENIKGNYNTQKSK